MIDEVLKYLRLAEESKYDEDIRHWYVGAAYGAFLELPEKDREKYSEINHSQDPYSVFSRMMCNFSKWAGQRIWSNDHISMRNKIEKYIAYSMEAYYKRYIEAEKLSIQTVYDLRYSEYSQRIRECEGKIRDLIMENNKLSDLLTEHQIIH